MRLQLSVQRHTLPPTHILFSTASHPAAHTSAKHATISDLLHDVNELVPIESDDGEWGLEDYTVEIAATADQDNVYEALHFQTIDSVLREDDEVIIRYLKSDELKGRRWGGRLQVAKDGRHLVDGVVFGRRWLGAQNVTSRPGLNIPPRKKRRILLTEENNEIPAGESLLALMEHEDKEQDDDYEDEGEDDEVKISTIFYDADEGDENGDEDDEMSDVEEDELQLLLQDAEEVESSGSALSEAMLERQLRDRTAPDSHLGKRKRAGNDGLDESEFEGFSTPVKQTARRRVQFEADLDDIMDDVITKLDEDNETSESDYESESESSSSESDEDDLEGITQDTQRTAQDQEDDTSSSGTSASESDESEPSDSSSESELSESETSSSSESESDSESKKAPKPMKTAHATAQKAASATTKQAQQESLVPPSEGSIRTHAKNDRKKRVGELKRLKEQGLLPENANFAELQAYKDNLGKPQSSTETQQQDLQAARLKALENIQSLDTQLKPEALKTTQPETQFKDSSLKPADETKSPMIPETETASTSEQPPASDSATKRSRLDVAASRRLVFGSLGLRTPKSKAEEEALRAKLAGSSKVNETALKPEYGLDGHHSPPQNKPGASVDDESWKGKLIISAVECEKHGVKMDPPPFPFKQHWMKRNTKGPEQVPELDYGDEASSPAVPPPDLRFQDVPDATQRMKVKKLCGSLPNFTIRECYNALLKSDWNHEDAVNLLFSAEASSGPGGGHDIGSQPIQHVDETSNDSRTVSFAKDDLDGMPIPTDFAALPDLERTHVLPGAVVAYKENHLGPTFQPEVSPYRIAKVEDFDEDSWVNVTLAVKDRRGPPARDLETGEIITNNFEIRTDEDDETDDGVRQIPFAMMLDAKLVQAGDAVPQTEIAGSLRGGDAVLSAQEGSSIVPDSMKGVGSNDAQLLPVVEVEQIEVDTPRRREIHTLIRDAGFDSAMDDQLLAPLSAKAESVALESETKVVSGNETSTVVETVQSAQVDARSQSPSDVPFSDSASPAQDAQSPDMQEDESGHDDEDQTSSPPVSPQLTVEYPQLSQMEVNSSFHVAEDSSKESGSHQDAQRVPGPPIADITLATTAEHEESFPMDDGDEYFDDDPIDELPSEVPQSQSQEVNGMDAAARADDDDPPTPRTSSFLGKRGVDGPASSPRFFDKFYDSDEDHKAPGDGTDSDDSLPSLAELTSSQRRKISSKKAVPSNPSTSHRKVSPPALARKTKENSKSIANAKSSVSKKRSTPSHAYNFDGADDLPPSSQPELQSSIDPLQDEIKIAPSQQEKRLSEIPPGTQVVDLTLSSDPVSPSDSGSEYGRRSRRSTSRGKKTSSVNGTRAKTRSSTLGTSLSDLGGTKSGTGVGIGTRRFLTAKKSRSQI